MGARARISRPWSEPEDPRLPLAGAYGARGLLPRAGRRAVVSGLPAPPRCVFTPVPRSIESKKPPKPLRHTEGPPAPPDHGEGALTGKGTTVKGAGKELMVRRMKPRRRKGGAMVAGRQTQGSSTARRAQPLLAAVDWWPLPLPRLWRVCSHLPPPPCRPCQCEDFTRSMGVVGCVCWLSDCHTRPGSRLKMRSQVCVY